MAAGFGTLRQLLKDVLILAAFVSVIAVLGLCGLLRLMALEVGILREHERMVESARRHFQETDVSDQTGCWNGLTSFDHDNLCQSTLNTRENISDFDDAYCPLVSVLVIPKGFFYTANPVRYDAYIFSYSDLSEFDGVIRSYPYDSRSVPSVPKSSTTTYCPNLGTYAATYRYEKSVWPW